MTDAQIREIVDAAMGDDQDWAGAVDAALREAGFGLGDAPDGSDPWHIATYWSIEQTDTAVLLGVYPGDTPEDAFDSLLKDADADPADYADPGLRFVRINDDIVAAAKLFAHVSRVDPMIPESLVTKDAARELVARFPKLSLREAIVLCEAILSL